MKKFRPSGKAKKKISKVPLIIGGILCVFVLLLMGVKLHDSLWFQNPQCTTSHQTTSKSLESLVTAQDYFDQGNYDYDIGNCGKAITAYTQSLVLNPNFAEAYNNRAYTYMMQNDYADALPDLDRAIALRPTYVHALMNRGDIYNYNYHINRTQAIADYDRVIALGQSAIRTTSVCGHRLMAVHNGFLPMVFLNFFISHSAPGC